MSVWGVSWEDGVVLGKQEGQKSDHDCGLYLFTVVKGRTDG